MAAGAVTSTEEAAPRAGSRLALGLGICLAGVLVFARDLHGWLGQHDPRVAAALVGGALAACATALGTLPVAFSHRCSARTHETLLGFGAGVMLAATSFSLVMPALRAARAQGAGAWAAGATVGVAILVGAGLLLAIDRVISRRYPMHERDDSQAQALRRTWLFVFAISLHNVPEGMAIGVAFGGPDPLGARALATGIAIQDVPEGLVVALALRGAGCGRAAAILLGTASGVVEPVFAVMGAAVMTLSVQLLPWGLAGAAGAMLWVIGHEVIPEANRRAAGPHPTIGLMLGFVTMMLLDTALV